MEFIKDKRIAHRNIDGTLYIVSPWNHMLHKFNGTATCIWEMLDKKYSREKIIGILTDQFDVTRNDAEKDFDSFTDDLLKKGLFKKHDESVARS